MGNSDEDPNKETKCQSLRGEYGELLIMPADGRWHLTRHLKG